MGGVDKTGKALDPNIRFTLETFLCGAQGNSLIALDPIARLPQLSISLDLEKFKSLYVHVVIYMVGYLSILRGCQRLSAFISPYHIIIFMI